MINSVEPMAVGSMQEVGVSAFGEERFKNLGHGVTPSLPKANARIMVGGGSVMDLESQKMLLGSAFSGTGPDSQSGMILSAYA